jgi:transcriptional regulator with XRE-family HTH domain
MLHGSQDYTGVHVTQENSTQNFTRRLERLKFSRGWTDEELAKQIDVSRRMLWLNRTGKRPISAKTWYKVEQQERATAETSAGIVVEAPVSVVDETAPKQQEDVSGKEQIIDVRNEVREIAAVLRDLAVRIERLENLLNK